MVEASFSNYWIYHKIKIHFEIWNWSWKVQLFLLLFFQKSVKIFNFSFKYIEIRAGYQGDDYGRWRTNYIFLWYSINLWISIETVEKIKYLDDFLVSFRIGAKKRSKWRFHYPYIDGRASVTLKLQHYLHGQQLHFEHFFAPD